MNLNSKVLTMLRVYPCPVRNKRRFGVELNDFGANENAAERMGEEDSNN
jgi:hypothetical protein